MVNKMRSSQPTGFWHIMGKTLYLPHPQESARLGLLNPGWNHVPSDLLLPILCSGVLLAAIFLGSLRQIWGLKDGSIGNIEIDAELQLVIIGVVNKSLDVLVQSALERLAMLYNTLWMTQPGVGSTIQDMLLKNEMTKPWEAVYAYHRRGRIVGYWKWHSIRRLLLTLAVSISVILLGASLNTIAWPKRRWYPDHTVFDLAERSTSDLTIRSPLMTLQRVDWGEEMRIGLALVGGTPQIDENGVPLLTDGAADEVAGAIATSEIFFTLTRLVHAYYISPPDWVALWATSAYTTGIQTRINGSTVRSISVQSKHVKTVFDEQIINGNSFARHARGFHGIVQMTCPVLTTTCAELTSEEVSENTIDVQLPKSNSTAFAVLIGPSSNLGFAGAACTLTLSQALVPVSTWIVDMQESPFVDIYNFSAPIIPRQLPVSTNAADALIAARLAAHFKSITPMLNGKVPSFGIVPHLALISRKLRAQSPDFASDVAGIASVIATMAQQQLSTSTWVLTTHNDTMITSAPVQWQIYGSGPRLPWAWVAMVVIVILVLVMGKLSFLTLVYKIQPGPWFEPGDLLRTAHKTPQVLESVAKVHASGDLKQREAIVKCANDGVLYGVKETPDQWPVFVEMPIVSDWDVKRKTRSKHGQSASVPNSNTTVGNKVNSAAPSATLPAASPAAPPAVPPVASSTLPTSTNSQNSTKNTITTPAPSSQHVGGGLTVPSTTLSSNSSPSLGGTSTQQITPTTSASAILPP